MTADAMRSLHTMIDKDSDGFISLSDGESFVTDVSSTTFKSQSTRILRHMDSNGDGRLSADEFAADLEKMEMDLPRRVGLQNRFTYFDSNGDGTLILDEAVVLFCYLFRLQALDLDGDGALDPEEFQLVAADAVEGKEDHHVEKSKAEGEFIFKELDADGDGVLNPHEYFLFESGVYAGAEAWRMLFEMADEDKDGVLIDEELVAVREHKGFGGSAAFHHSKWWIDAIEAMVARAAKEVRERIEASAETINGSGETRGSNKSDETTEL